MKQGLWNREKKEAKWGKQVYWYSIGEVDLLFPHVRSDQTKRPDQPDKMSASKPRTSTFRKTLPFPQAEQQNSRRWKNVANGWSRCQLKRSTGTEKAARRYVLGTTANSLNGESSERHPKPL